MCPTWALLYCPVKNILQEVLLHRLVSGADDPVLQDAADLIDILLAAPVVLGRVQGGGPPLPGRERHERRLA